MTTSISREDGRSLLMRIAEKISPVLGKPVTVEGVERGDPSILVKEEICFAVDVSLYIGFRGRPGDPQALRVEVNGSSCRKTPAEARVWALLCARFADAACIAETMAEGQLYRTGTQGEGP